MAEEEQNLLPLLWREHELPRLTGRSFTQIETEVQFLSGRQETWLHEFIHGVFEAVNIYGIEAIPHVEVLEIPDADYANGEELKMALNRWLLNLRENASHRIFGVEVGCDEADEIVDGVALVDAQHSDAASSSSSTTEAQQPKAKTTVKSTALENVPTKSVLDSDAFLAVMNKLHPRTTSGVSSESASTQKMSEASPSTSAKTPLAAIQQAQPYQEMADLNSNDNPVQITGPASDISVKTPAAPDDGCVPVKKLTSSPDDLHSLITVIHRMHPVLGTREVTVAVPLQSHPAPPPTRTATPSIDDTTAFLNAMKAKKFTASRKPHSADPFASLLAEAHPQFNSATRTARQSSNGNSSSTTGPAAYSIETSHPPPSD